MTHQFFSFSSLRYSFVRLACVVFLITLAACSHREIDHSNDFANNGRDTQGIKRASLYLKESLPPQLPRPDTSFANGLEQQRLFLNKKKADAQFPLENITVTQQDLIGTLNSIQTWLDNPSQQPDLTAYQLAGQDQRGNVQITGYYVPVLKVRRVADDVYKYPLYRKPQPLDDGSFPSREEIDFEGALAGQGLEIAYSANLVDNFFLHVQGSGMVEFADGSQELLSWGGVNGHAYRSLGKELIERGEIDRANISAQSIRQWLQDHPHRMREILSTNPSYLFFSEGLEKPVGAANVPLTPLYSAAVDPSVIPLGAVLLAQAPQLDEQGNLIGHEFRLLLAQDKGGAIKGSGHIDWYQGVGPEAQFHAGQLKHFGKVWLLLPRQNSNTASDN